MYQNTVNRAALPPVSCPFGFFHCVYETITLSVLTKIFCQPLLKEAVGGANSGSGKLRHARTHTHTHTNASGNLLTGNDSSVSGPHVLSPWLYPSFSLQFISLTSLVHKTQLWTRLSQLFIRGFISAFKNTLTLWRMGIDVSLQIPSWHSSKLSPLGFHQDMMNCSVIFKVFGCYMVTVSLFFSSLLKIIIVKLPHSFVSYYTSPPVWNCYVRSGLISNLFYIGAKRTQV